METSNKSKKTIQSFGDEWTKFDQSTLDKNELDTITARYFDILPDKCFNKKTIGFDLGCGSGRFSLYLVDKVKTLHCIEPSSAIEIAKKKLSKYNNCIFHNVSVYNMRIPNNSMDFGISLGVLHHVDDTLKGLKNCNKILKSGAPFLIYLYYAFDNKPFWFRLIWKISNLIRLLISSMPKQIKFILSEIIALLIYLPLARLSKFIEKYFKINVDNVPLSAYRNLSYYTMRTDSLDRFGTKIEKRFTKKQIIQMLTEAGFTDFKFSSEIPFWCVTCYKK